MEQLWKKESRRSGANYVDCFKKIDEEQKEQVYDWLRQQCKRTKKRKRGPKPKPGGQQPISHDRVLRKRKLAEPTEVPSKQKKIDKRRRSQKAGINRKANGRVFSPKLSFKPHDQFPDIANVLEIKHDEQFGRHVVAKCNIEVGQIIAKGEPFADAVVCQSSTRRSYCLTCKKIGTDFIDCENCADVKFCSEICRSMNRVHHLECNSIFHHIDSLDVKLTIQMILIAIKGFSTADKFIRHCETLLANDSLCKNGLMLRLTQSSCGDEVFRAYKAYQCLMTMQSINKLFSTLRTKRFLMHLVLQYTAIVPWNNWTIDINDDENFGEFLMILSNLNGFVAALNRVSMSRCTFVRTNCFDFFVSFFYSNAIHPRCHKPVQSQLLSERVLWFQE